MQAMRPTYHSANGDRLTWICSGYKPPNLHKWGPGVRDIYALHYIVSGKGILETRNATYTLKAGDSFIIFPQTEVFYYPDHQDPWEYVWTEFKGEEASLLLSMTELNLQHPIVTDAPVNMEPLFHISQNMASKPYEHIRTEAKLRLLLSYYMEHYPKETVVEPIPYVRIAKETIHNNYWKASLTVSDIVSIVKIERSYLFRLFKEEMGMSVLSYLTAYRVERACELLKTTQLSIKTIAFSVGYKDQMYFAKVFKKATSYTPTEYMMLHATEMLTKQ